MKLRWIALAMVTVVALRGSCRCRSETRPLRFATFNIEDFPKHDRQIDGAFAELAALEVEFVGVQEIVDPELFERTARARLGERWRFAYADTAPPMHPTHHLGVLFDSARWTHLSTMVHDETRLVEGRHKPTLEVRLRSRAGEVVRILVVHLKAGGDGREIRARQYVALASIVRAARRSGEQVVLLGDFNATDDRADREDLAALAATGGLAWATEPLACSAFWDREDGCFRSRLDHALVSMPVRRVEAAGACATEGCARQDRCPLYAREVSDHCPVVIETTASE